MSENGQNQNPTDKIADAAGKVAESVRHAIEEGIEAIRPTWEEKVAPKVVPVWEEKVAPVVATGAEKVAEWGDEVRDTADRKAAELNAEDRPSSKILGGALGVGAAAVALGTGAARALGKAAAESAAHEPAAPSAADAPTADAAPSATPVYDAAAAATPVDDAPIPPAATDAGTPPTDENW